MTTTEIFNQVVETEKINLNSKFRLERNFCLDKMIEKVMSLGHMTRTELENKVVEFEQVISENFSK